MQIPPDGPAYVIRIFGVCFEKLSNFSKLILVANNSGPVATKHPIYSRVKFPDS